MRGHNYDVLLLRPHEITDVIDMAQAIDLVEQGYREAHGFPIINAPRRRVHSRSNVRISSFPGGVDARQDDAGQDDGPDDDRAKQWPQNPLRSPSLKSPYPWGAVQA